MEDRDEVEPAGFTEDGVEVRLLIGQHIMINADQTGLLRHLVFFKAVDIASNFKTFFCMTTFINYESYPIIQGNVVDICRKV